jgi:hypothetical protein
MAAPFLSNDPQPLTPPALEWILVIQRKAQRRLCWRRESFARLHEYCLVLVSRTCQGHTMHMRLHSRIVAAMLNCIHSALETSQKEADTTGGISHSLATLCHPAPREQQAVLTPLMQPTDSSCVCTPFMCTAPQTSFGLLSSVVSKVVRPFLARTK